MKRVVYIVALLSCIGATQESGAKPKKAYFDYEIVIANNTDKPMHWHLETTGNDYSSKDTPLQPGKVKKVFTGNPILRFKATFKEHGKKTEQRGYKIPGDLSGKDWIFSVNGEPFRTPWNVCGLWKKTRVQGEAEIGGIIAGSALAIAAITVATMGSATMPTIATVGAVAAPGGAAAAGITTVTGVTLTTAGAAATGAVAIGSTTAATDILASNPQLFALSKKMKKDKCMWYGK